MKEKMKVKKEKISLNLVIPSWISDRDQTSVSFNNKTALALPSSEKQNIHWRSGLYFNIIVIH